MKRAWSRPSPTKAQQLTALRSNLGMRRSLDGVAPASLARSYGVTEQEAADALAQERRARAAKAKA